MPAENWTVAAAKAKLSQLIDRALSEGPQSITRNGRPAVVVVSATEWDRKTRRVGTLADFLDASPLGGAEIDLERVKDSPRPLDL